MFLGDSLSVDTIEQLIDKVRSNEYYFVTANQRKYLFICLKLCFRRMVLRGREQIIQVSIC
jgi:hypothetical protein